MALTVIAVSAVAASVIWLVVHQASSLVRRWQPSSFRRRTAGPLSVLDSGPRADTDEVVVLMHGVGATSDYFGDTYDGLSRKRRVVMVDMLGFGRSLDEERTDFGVDAHVRALDRALRALELDAADLVVAAHSMSAAVALSWAEQHPARVRHVYLWGPPVYRIGAASESVGAEYGVMGRLFMLDTRWAERLCRFNCAHRTVSGALMAMLAPRWPTPVSSRASRHTWDAYRGSLQSLIFDVDWSTVLPARVPVTVFHGENDPIGDQEYIVELVGPTSVVTVPHADHHVALAHPEVLFDALDDL